MDSTDIRFDGWTLRRDSGELSRDGATQRLPPQPLGMLLALLDNAGQVVTRESLVRVLWPRGIVDFDNSLNAVVRKLRVALGDDPEAPRYIETIPRIGYRFLGKIERAELGAGPTPPAMPVPAKRRWLTPMMALLAGCMVIAALAWVLWPRHRAPVAVAAAAAQPPRHTTSDRAYDLYLQGMFNRSRRDIAGSNPAIENFEAALQEDPYYADAWAALAETLSGAAMTQAAPVVPTYERARTAALRALELDENLSHGHAALAHIVIQFDRDFARGEAEIERARAAEPGYSRSWHMLALLRAFQGRMPEAFDAMRRARELEPMTLLYNANYGFLLYYSRRYDEAIEHVKPLLAAQSRFDQARSVLIRALVAKGDVKQALEQLPLRVNERPTISDTGLVYAHAGRRSESLAEIESIERLGREGFGVGYDIAVIDAALGDLPAACAALERAVNDHSLSLNWMRIDPRMDPLRDEACYQQIARNLGKGSAHQD